MNKISTLITTSLISYPAFAHGVSEEIGLFLVAFAMLCIVMIIHSSIRTIQYTMESDYKVKTAVLSIILSISFISICLGISVGIISILFNLSTSAILNGIILFSSPIFVGYIYFKLHHKVIEKILNKII
jgi:hypothetical protein